MVAFWSKWFGASEDRYTDDWLKGIERGILSATGIVVTVPDALTVPGIAACIQVNSEDIAKVPLELKRKTDVGYVAATEHPLYAKLKYGPSDWLSPYKWRKALAHGAMAWGNHYSRVRSDGAGLIQLIAPLSHGQCSMRWTNDGEPVFDIMTMTGGVERGLSWQEVIHVGYRDSTDGGINGGVLGVSPIMQNKETVALMIAAERFAALFFKNGAQPSMILEYDKKLPNDEVANRIRAGIERVYGGLDNKWKIAILEMGMKLRETSSDPQKSQMTETRRLGAEQACTMYRTPPHKIGILDKATFSNIEQQEIGYVTGSISSLAKSIESAITIACLTPKEREIYRVEHNLEGLMRGDLLSRYRAYAIGRQWGWLSVNKILQRESENSIGPKGDEYLTPLNMIPAGEDPTKDDPADQNQKPGQAEAFDARLSEAWARPGFGSFNPEKADVRRLRRASIVGASGEPLYL